MLRALPLLLLCSCNRYDMFAVAGFVQESFSPKADILFVIDNSESMQEEAEALATSFSTFIADLGREQADFPTDGLSDAVRFYANSTDGKSDFVNYQLAIVTTDGSTEGQLRGAGRLTRFDDAIDRSFARSLLCDATCFLVDPPNDPTHQCGDPLGADVSIQWLDCECSGDWRNNCGPPREEPLEAVLMAMCRSVPNPPAACFDPAYSSFSEADVLSAGPFLRPDATFIPVVISDEGDDSRRMETGVIDPEPYERLYDQFDQRMVWTYIGPDRSENGDYRCGAGQNATLRIQHLVESTGGLYVPINDFERGCEARDFDDTLAALGDLLKSLNRSFRLKSLPEDGTIAVYTSDGGAVRPAELLGTSDAGVPIYDDGWSYDRATNTVLLHGNAVPGFDETVTVYYLPLDGNPRHLPF